MRHPDYPVLIEPLPAEDGGGYLATVPDLPGCMSDGETRELAARNVEDAISAWIEEATTLGRAIPAPSHHLLVVATPRGRQMDMRNNQKNPLSSIFEVSKVAYSLRRESMLIKADYVPQINSRRRSSTDNLVNSTTKKLEVVQSAGIHWGS